ncbi:hypothetical protein O3M35_005890 [Rhynocoris fuscipes]|uniref:Uncharacterized protein n=1 Tax=Rhynocoris fuscipes TaxID=488301 RepID=A0AAW1DKS6_9HEMI
MYWPYPSPPVSPPVPAPHLVIMCPPIHQEPHQPPPPPHHFQPIEGWGFDCLGNVVPAFPQLHPPPVHAHQPA